MHEGRQNRAVRYLLEAAGAPPSDEIAYSAADFNTHRLLTLLLEAGERDSIIQFLEHQADVNVLQRNEMLEAAAAIRKGKAPKWYRPRVR
jgi:hypothetical protein